MSQDRDTSNYGLFMELSMIDGLQDGRIKEKAMARDRQIGISRTKYRHRLLLKVHHTAVWVETSLFIKKEKDLQ